MGLDKQKPIKVSCNPVYFGGHRHGGSGDIMILVRHVILQDHVIKGLWDTIGRNRSE